MPISAMAPKASNAMVEFITNRVEIGIRSLTSSVDRTAGDEKRKDVKNPRACPGPRPCRAADFVPLTRASCVQNRTPVNAKGDADHEPTPHERQAPQISATPKFLLLRSGKAVVYKALVRYEEPGQQDEAALLRATILGAKARTVLAVPFRLLSITSC
jgi:hypothetical protein